MRYVFTAFILFFILFLTAFSCGRAKVIETIGGHDISSTDYEEYYEASIDLASRMAGADRKLVSKMVCNEESSLNTALKPENHYNRYRDALMVARVAENEGFLDDANVQRMLEQSRLQTIGQLYINAKLLEAIEISEEDKIKTCKSLRKKEPKKMAALSLDDCLEIAEGVLKRRLVSEKSEQVVNSIRESITVKKNTDFDQKNYLKNLSSYKELRESGGCPAPESKENKESKESKKKQKTKDKK